MNRLSGSGIAFLYSCVCMSLQAWEVFCTAGRFGQHYGKSASDSGCDGERAEVDEQDFLRSSGTTSGKRHDG